MWKYHVSWTDHNPSPNNPYGGNGKYKRFKTNDEVMEHVKSLLDDGNMSRIKILNANEFGRGKR